MTGIKKPRKNDLRKEARGRECQIRIPRVCNFNPETTVLCHMGGGGMAMKHHDILASWGCSNCHGAIDGQIKTDFTRDELKIMHYEGMWRTIDILIKEGKI